MPKTPARTRAAKLMRDAVRYEDDAGFWRYAGWAHLAAFDERRANECRAEARKLKRVRAALDNL